MPFKVDAQIYVVNYWEIALMWPTAKQFIIAGLKADTVRTLGCVLAKVWSGEESLWMIVADGVPCAAFVTTMKTENGKRFLGVSNLGGSGVNVWGRQLAAEMTAFARVNDCASVRFYGRKAWARLLPRFEIVEQRDAKIALFERAV